MDTDQEVQPGVPVRLFDDGVHRVYWTGISDETAFRCNSYLIQSGDEALVVDPGNRRYFPAVRDTVATLVEPASVSAMILCHQDPDVAASMIDWLELNPDMLVLTSARAHVLLAHYGAQGYRKQDTARDDRYVLRSGRELRFLPAPFLHFAGAMATYDASSRFLLSGDVWAALDTDWRLIVRDFEQHTVKLDLFHVDYMASNVATRGFARSLAGLQIDAILPQHGSIIAHPDVRAAIDYLENLQCGTDLIYPQL